MTVSFEKNETELKLTANVEGSIDTVTSHLFESQVAAALDGIKQLILNFAEVDYISSSGLRVILGLSKRMSDQGTMHLEHLNPEVREVFEITGFDELLDIRS